LVVVVGWTDVLGAGRPPGGAGLLSRRGGAVISRKRALKVRLVLGSLEVPAQFDVRDR
jgi:hypothetical protein